MHVSIVNDLVECQQPPGKHHKTRAVSALSQHGKTWLADVIANCKKGKRCGIIFCGSCRHRFAKEAEQRMLEHVQGRIQRDGPDAEKELRFLTVLLDVVYPASVKEAVKEARKQLKAFAKEFPNVWMQGAFEFEMINLRLLFAKKGKNRKCEVIKSMLNWGSFQGGLPLGSDPLSLYPDDLVLVHYHCLVDLNGSSATEVRDWLTKKYPGRYIVELKRTNEGQKLNDKCRKIGSYLFKERVQYNLTMETKGHENGEYMSDKALSKLVCLYDSFSVNKKGQRIGVKKLLIKH